MFPALSRTARRRALLIAVLAAISVLAQFLYLNAERAESPAATALEMARYFTILTNLMAAVTFGLISRPSRDGVPAPWLAALTLAMVMVGAVYHLLLSDLVAFTGLGWWADHGLHTAAPAAVLLWWLAHAPKRRLVYADLPMFVLWPSVYAAYALGRGAHDANYPYPFIDRSELGAAEVALNLAGLMVVFLLGGVIMISIGRFTDR